MVGGGPPAVGWGAGGGRESAGTITVPSRGTKAVGGTGSNLMR